MEIEHFKLPLSLSCITLLSSLAACGGGSDHQSHSVIAPSSSTASPLLATADARPSARAMALANAPAVDLCEGLIVDDKSDRPMTPLDQPDVGAVAIDPQFGTNIRRITGAGGGNVIKPAYSTIPAWNADESLMILYHTGTSSVPHGSGHHLYDGNTYQWIKSLDFDPPDLEQFFWDASDPRAFLFVDSANRLTRYHIDIAGTDSLEVVHEFTCDSGRLTGGSHGAMYTSWDSDLLAFRCGPQIFAYRISTNTESPRIVETSNESAFAPVAAPSGNSIFYGISPAVETFDTNMSRLATIIVDGDTHGSLGRLANGADVFNAVSFDVGPIGSLVQADLSGTVPPRVIVGPATGYPYPPGSTHVNSSAFYNPGWVGISVVGSVDGQTVLNQELLIANTNPAGAVCRIAHHRSWGKLNPTQGYWAEPHPVMSPSGTRMLFGSDWGGQDSVDSYVVELPTYRR